MTTKATHDPQRCAELVRALRELARRAPGPGLDPSARWNLELADQLEAAGREVASGLERIENLHGDVSKVRDLYEQTTTERDTLRAQLDHAVSENFAFNLRAATEINEARAERDALRADLADRDASIVQLIAQRNEAEKQRDAHCAAHCAEVERLTSAQWTCPTCAFTCAAIHVSRDTPQCPACEEARLREENERMRAEVARLREDLDHATCHEGDHLGKASRRMVETVMGDREALRAKVREMAAENERLRTELSADRLHETQEQFAARHAPTAGREGE